MKTGLELGCSTLRSLQGDFTAAFQYTKEFLRKTEADFLPLSVVTEQRATILN